MPSPDQRREPSARALHLTFLGLMLLLALTFGVSFLPLGGLGTALALLIALAKAALVLLFFMQLAYVRAKTRFFALAALLWLGILVSFVVSDYLSRGALGIPGK